jgi:serine/threonine protein kinase
LSVPSSGLNWDRLEALYDRVGSLSSSDRTAFLDQLRGEEPELADRLVSLLLATGSAASFFTSLQKTLFASDDGVEDPADLLPKVDPLFGTMVGPYRIETVVGRGGMGVVYRAVHTELDEPRALKLLPSYATASREARRRFATEARATADVRHPNVGEIYEVGESDGGRLFLAMPFYEGESLKERFRRGALPAEEALDWFRQACAGLAAVHAAGIIHRDVTPGNLLRTSEGVVKLLDFGLAKIAEVTLGTGNRPLGTVAYMSPEQLGGGEVDHRTDLWSLGVVLYEMVAGERPFQGATLSALRGQILDPVAITGLTLPRVASGLTELLRCLLPHDPDERPASAKMVLERLDEANGQAGG